MPVLYVAKSAALQEWGADVGISKHIYKFGVADGDAAAAVKDLNDTKHAGQTDWQLVSEETVAEGEPESFLERLAKREKMVDPLYYPRIKGEKGIFKVNPTTVESSILVKRALAGHQIKSMKLKPADIGAYLIQNALQ